MKIIFFALFVFCFTILVQGQNIDKIKEECKEEHRDEIDALKGKSLKLADKPTDFWEESFSGIKKLSLIRKISAIMDACVKSKQIQAQDKIKKECQEEHRDELIAMVKNGSEKVDKAKKIGFFEGALVSTIETVAKGSKINAIMDACVKSKQLK